MKAIRERLSFANVASGIALFVALGGTAYAASSLPAGSVGQREIKTGGVGKGEIKTGGVGKSEIAQRAVAKSEIRTGGVGKSEIRTDAVGPAEVRQSAIDTTELKDGGIEAVDLSAAARGALNNVPFRTSVSAAGAQTAGNAKAVAHAADSGVYTVDFDPDLSSCQLAATRGTPGLITAEINAADKTQVVVTTTDTANPPVPADAPFHLLVAC